MKTTRSAFCFFFLLCLLGALAAAPAGAALLVSIGQNFTGSTYAQDSFLLPPDANGAVGPNHFAELVNGRFAVFLKTNGTRVKTISDLTFWSQAGVSVPANWAVTDPRLFYDPTVQRWFASQVDFAPNGSATTNHFLLAVSATDDPTGAWKAVAFGSDPTGLNFADFPTLGLDAHGVYLSGDLFDSNENPVGATLVSIPKADLLASAPSAASRTSFGILSYGDFGDVLQPVVAVDGSAGGDVLAVGDLGLDFLPHSTLVASTILNAGGPGAATLDPATTISVDPYLVPINPPQPDGSHNLDDGDARVSAPVFRVNGVLFAVHGTEISNRAAIRWYRISATNHTVLESGTIADTNLDLFYPSIAANTNGVVMIGCNGSSLNTFISAYAVAGETINGVTTFGNLLLLKSGVASFQNVDSRGISRWGDYSTTSVDPADSSRFWTIQTWPSSPQDWSTQIIEMQTIRIGLTITPTPTNAAMLLCWPSQAGNFQLQSTADLGAINSWTLVNQARVTNGNQICVSVPSSGAAQFFRLKQEP